MNQPSNELTEALDLAGLEIDDLEISNFLDDTLVQQSGAVSKVMAASCTTCECCCSCCLLVAKTEVLLNTTRIAQLEGNYSPEQLKIIKLRDPKTHDPQRYAEAAWPELIHEISTAMAKGIDPISGHVRSLAQRWVELVYMFSGGHPGVEETLHNVYRKTPHPANGLGQIPDQKMMDYVAKAMSGQGT